MAPSFQVMLLYLVIATQLHGLAPVESTWVQRECRNDTLLNVI